MDWESKENSVIQSMLQHLIGDKLITFSSSPFSQGSSHLVCTPLVLIPFLHTAMGRVFHLSGHATPARPPEKHKNKGTPQISALRLRGPPALNLTVCANLASPFFPALHRRKLTIRHNHTGKLTDNSNRKYQSSRQVLLHP